MGGGGGKDPGGDRAEHQGRRSAFGGGELQASGGERVGIGDLSHHGGDRAAAHRLFHHPEPFGTTPGRHHQQPGGIEP
ncbi:MAG: hypothetical protein CMO29_21270, partial [Tistrella sp.]|nr:hypothetical protein [Tistrella sp.]